jgi:hypothetical protein
VCGLQHTILSVGQVRGSSILTSSILTIALAQQHAPPFPRAVQRFTAVTMLQAAVVHVVGSGVGGTQC